MRREMTRVGPLEMQLFLYKVKYELNQQKHVKLIDQIPLKNPKINIPHTKCKKFIIQLKKEKAELSQYIEVTERPPTIQHHQNIFSTPTLIQIHIVRKRALVLTENS